MSYLSIINTYLYIHALLSNTVVCLILLVTLLPFLEFPTLPLSVTIPSLPPLPLSLLIYYQFSLC